MNKKIFNLDKLNEHLSKYLSQIGSPSWVLLHCYDSVGIYTYPLKFPISVSKIRFLRFFSEGGELYLWKIGEDEYRERWKDDAANKTLPIYPETHYLWGTQIKEKNILKEKNRGMEIKFSFDISEYTPPFLYEVKNYYKFDEDGLIQFSDARLVRIQDNKQRVVQEK